ncbi:MAG: Long-chain-fatty-acid--CoA ligase FadD15 [Deltaproteobacteria bacterium ADurb.Bin058]|jgi:long-subunit acyl-CoA synthetase (AMP-forming)|nr:MAG: Long-chain-fatty-acid--CoA ligase FadD15 [Deltaproteobacteria bacterium ADurb.Bin058]
MSITSIIRTIQSNARHYGPKTVLQVTSGHNQVEYSWVEVWNALIAIAEQITAAQLPHERTVGIMAPQSGSTTLLLELGILAAKGVVCYLDPPYTQAQLDQFVFETRPYLIFAPKEEWDRIIATGDKFKEPIACLPIPTLQPDYAQNISQDLENRLAILGPDAPSLSLRTGAKTKAIQRCNLSHKSVCAISLALAQTIGATPSDVWLMPNLRARPFDKLAGHYAAITTGGEIAIVESQEPLELIKQLWLARPTILVCTASHLEQLVAQVEAETASLGGLQGWLLRSALAAAGLKEQTLKDKLAAPFLSKIQLEIFGGRLRTIVTGLGAIAPSTRKFFHSIGIDVRGTYGVAEASGIVTIDASFADVPPENVGFPLPGVELKITSDGKILASGAGMMQNYRRSNHQDDPQFEDGWVHTDDLGRMNPDGSLVFLGRQPFQVNPEIDYETAYTIRNVESAGRSCSNPTPIGAGPELHEPGRQYLGKE